MVPNTVAQVLVALRTVNDTVRAQYADTAVAVDGTGPFPHQVNATITWSSSDSNTANVAPSTGSVVTITLRKPGPATITVSAGGVSQPVNVNVTSARPSKLKALSDTALTGVVGAPVTPAPSVKVTDATGNAKSGASVTFVVKTGNGTVPATTAQTDTTGSASVGSWTLGIAAKTDTLFAIAYNDTVMFMAKAKPGPISAASTITVSPSTVAAGSASTVTLQARDSYGNALSAGGATVVFSASGGSSTGQLTAATDNHNGTYTASFSGRIAGSPTTIGATINAAPITTVLPTITVTPGPPSAATSVVTVASASILFALQEQLQLRTKDAFGNSLTTGGAVVAFTQLPSPGHGGGLIGPAVDNHDGTYSAVYFATVIGGPNPVGATINGAAVTTAAPVIAVQEGSSTPWMAVTTGSSDGEYTCALTVVNQLACWGAESWGNLGDNQSGPFNDVTSPEYIVTGPPFFAISAYGVTCAISTTGVGYCWGGDSDGGLTGTGQSFVTVPTPLAPAASGALTLRSISSGAQHACGITTSGDAYCWGHDFVGELGSSLVSITSKVGGCGFLPCSLVPALVDGNHKFQSISAGASMTCAVDLAGAAWCWGTNKYSALGNPTIPDSALAPVPVQAPAGVTFRQISDNGVTSCALAIDGTIWCWGDETLGNPSFTNSPIPVQVTSSKSFLTVTVGNVQVCAISTEPLMYCWGQTVYGTFTVPTAVPGNVPFLSTSAADQVCGITSTGIYCFGNDSEGQLGNGTTSSTPIQPPGVKL